MTTLRTPWQRRILALQATHPSIQRMADATEAYAAGMMSGDHRKRLVIIGGPGNGKTHVLECLWLWHRSIPVSRWPRGNKDGNTDGFACEFVDWPGLCRRAQKDGEDGQWLDAQQCGLLLLDDIGSEVDGFKSGEPTTLLRALLGARQQRWTVVTTNIPVANWRRSWDERVADRLFRDSRIVDLGDCPSFAFTSKPAQKQEREESKPVSDERLREWAQEFAQLRQQVTKTTQSL